jgi:hypothetical protein
MQIRVGNGRFGGVRALVVLPRGPSYDQITGRLPVDVDAENSRRFLAEIPGSLAASAANPLVPLKNYQLTSSYAFAPAYDSANLLYGTPHPPIPQ